MTMLEKNLFEATKKAVFEFKAVEREADEAETDVEYWEMVLEKKREAFIALYDVIVESGLEGKYAEWRYGKRANDDNH